MHLLVYDGSFSGLLCAVFDVYAHKMSEVRTVVQGQYTAPMFTRTHKVITDAARAKRVWTGLQQKLTPQGLQQVQLAWLSEQAGMADILISYMRYAFKRGSIEKDYGHSAVLAVSQTANKVHREKHRMEAFVRFQLTADQLYYAVIEPDFNVLPVISDHFKQRYADQRWLIYDARRHYGVYYDLENTSYVDISFEANLQQGKTIDRVYDEKEELYQHLWQRYFSSTNIVARKNTQLHIRHMPVRYWKYLIEKKPGK